MESCDQELETLLLDEEGQKEPVQFMNRLRGVFEELDRILGVYEKTPIFRQDLSVIRGRFEGLLVKWVERQSNRLARVLEEK